jgi:hypothetical protein
LTRSGSGKTNHLLNYAQTPRAPIDAFSSNQSTNSSSFSNHGFSLDAFRLDETQVDLAVNEALQSLAKRPVRGFSFLQQEEFHMEILIRRHEKRRPPANS